MAKKIGAVGSGGKANQGKWKSWYEQYGKYFKNVALVIAVILFYQVLSNTDRTYTSLSASKNSMLMLYLVVILVGYYIGGIPTAFKTAAIVGVVLLLIPVFLQMTPQQITRDVAGIIRPNVPPRDINWMTAKVGIEKADLFRVYTGDAIYYYANKGFWVEYEDGNKYFNNPSYNGQMMRFVITSAKKEGEIARVWSDEPFQLKYKVESRG